MPRRGFRRVSEVSRKGLGRVSEGSRKGLGRAARACDENREAKEGAPTHTQQRRQRRALREAEHAVKRPLPLACGVEELERPLDASVLVREGRARGGGLVKSPPAERLSALIGVDVAEEAGGGCKGCVDKDKVTRDRLQRLAQRAGALAEEGGVLSVAVQAEDPGLAGRGRAHSRQRLSHQRSEL